MLELQRRRFVRDRTQAIQRLRSDWTQQDPVGEAGALRANSQRELRRLKRIRFGDSLTDRIAARCIRELARDIEDLNQRIAALDKEIAELLDEHHNPLADLQGAGTNLTATVSPRPATFAASATPPPSRASAAPPRSPAAQAKPPDVTDYTAAATDNSTPRSTASPSSNNDTTPKPKHSWPANKPKAKHHAKPAVELTRFGGHSIAWAVRLGQEGCPDATNSTAVPTGVSPRGGGARSVRDAAQAGRC